MYYEIINPSDKCFFFAESYRIAGLVTVLLGSGQYSAQPEEETEAAQAVPFFMFGGFDEWWEEHGDGQPTEGAIDRHRDEVITVLRSVCYGDLRERALFEEAVAAIDDEDKKAAFVASWNDRHRSSLNDIMGRAHAAADSLSKGV